MTSHNSSQELPLSPFAAEFDPPKFNDAEMNKLLVRLSLANVSDIKIQSNNYVFAKIHGKVHRITQRKLPPQEVEMILSNLYGSNGPTIIKTGRDIDKSYELHPDRDSRFRYRLNAVGGTMNGQKSIEITARTINLEPPTLASMNVEQGIIEGAFPRDGIVLVVGPTGSGKSTLIASIIREMLADEDGNRFICTYESPIEYVFDSVYKPSSVIFQTEIGLSSDLPDFLSGIRNAMRRAPDVIFTGESRDLETVEASMAAAQSGHTVYTTLHANSVTDAFSRMANMFPPSTRAGQLNNLLGAVKMVVWQSLLKLPPSMGSGRVAIREYLVFTDEIRDELLSIGAENIAELRLAIKRNIKKHGQTAFDAAQRAHDDGKLTSAQLMTFK